MNVIQKTQNKVKLIYQNDFSLKDDIEPSTFRDLFRFADRTDYILMIVGSLCAIGNGVAIPFFAYPYGQMTQAFAPNVSSDFIVQQVKQAYIAFLINSIVVFLLSWLMFSSWMITSQRQSIKCRKLYFQALLEQEVAWYDHNRIQQLASNVYTQSNHLQNAIGQKVSKIFMTLSMGLTGFIIAFSRGWKLAIVIMCVIPFLLLAGFLNNHFLKSYSEFMRKISTRAQGIVQQVLYSIKTVKILNGQQFQSNNFNSQIAKVTEKAINYGYIRGLMSSLFFFCIIMTYTIGFWYGSILVSQKQLNSNSNNVYNVSDVIIIFFTVYMSGLNLGQVPQCIKNFAAGRKAAAKIFSILDRKPLLETGSILLEREQKQMKSSKTLLQQPIQIKDKIKIEGITFKNVKFYYQNPLFQNFNLQIKRGKIAFVGESGSGKSTIVGLILRFYDPQQGQICLNFNSRQINLKNLNLISFRQKIGYVGQQPVLIGNTIRQAISYTHRQQQQIIKALKQAQAWDFVKTIGLDSQFGSLSGGQKQRIAIARALIKKPDILILDEATSALDRKNEKQIQNTLDKLQVPFMIIIAHKIQTIKSANEIIVLQKGKLIQRGNYTELIKMRGSFYNLAKDQQKKQKQNQQKQQSELSEKNLTQKSQIIINQLKKQTKNKRNSNDSSYQLIKNKSNLPLVNQQNQSNQQNQTQNQFTWSLFWRLLSYNKKYIWLMVLGLISSLFTGTVFPLFSAFLSQIVVILSSLNYCLQSQIPKYQNQAIQLTKILFTIACISLVTHFLKTSSFIYLAQKLSYSVKKDVYYKLLYLPYSYHEVKKQGATILSGDCQAVNSLTSSLLSDILQNTTTLIVGLIIAFYYCWQITFVALAVIPILLLAGKAQMNFNVGFSTETDQAYKKSHQIVLLSILNYKTVLAFNLQKEVKTQYYQLLEEPLKIAIKKGNIAGLLFGFSQMVLSCILALIFFIGSIFIKNYQMNLLSIFTAIYAIMFAAVQAGGNLQFVPNIVQLKIAAVNIFKILDEKDQIQTENQRKSLGLTSPIKGQLQIKKISFKYETRENFVFKDISLKINLGEKVAFVGSSGCGKSTILQLILRMYQVSQGQILLDGKNIKDYDLQYLRSQFGIVSQQPVLFNRTISQNIIYNKSNITKQQLIKACQQANALNFITQCNFGFNNKSHANPQAQSENQLNIIESDIQGFSRKVGIRGSFLSGGQKQRIAIARAIVRKPKILLLDQATSALDTQNQQQVQNALDSIQGLTTIIVAHRLSTIQKCDKIFVFNKGEIVQQGKFEDLLEAKGYFYRLVNGIKEKKKKN